MKFGIALEPTMPLDRATKMAKVAEECSFDSVWVSDNNPSPPRGDIFVTLAALALTTSRVTLGTSLINPYTRNPAIVASAMLELDKFTKGRTVLGVGLGSQPLLNSIGVNGWGMPLQVMRRAVETFRRLFAGELVNVAVPGAFEVKDVRFKRARGGRIPIYIGTRGPQMLSLAGKIADGVLLTVRSNRFIPEAIGYIEKGAKQVNRSSKDGDIDITNSLVISIGEDVGEARDKAREVVAYLVAWQSEAMLKELGVKAAKQRKIREALERGKESLAARYVTDKMVEEFSAAGDTKKCLSKSREQIQSGIDHLIFCVPFGPDPINAIRIIGEEIVPRLR